MIKKRKMFLRMITASLLRRRSRMMVALLAIAIGAAILSGLVTIYYDVPRQMGAQFRNYGANMILTSTEEGFSEEEMEGSLSAIPAENLVGAAPYRYITVRIHEQPVLAAGTSMENVKKTSPYWLVEGKWPSNPNEILLGQTVAENLELHEGDTVSLGYTPENAAEEASADFTVAGILNTGGSEEDYVYISLDDMGNLTGVKGNIDLAEVSISADSDSLTEYMNRINAENPKLQAKLVKRVTASETAVLSKLQALVLLVTIIVLALTMICVATTMAAVVSERRKEIGLRKAIGASDQSIIGEFLGEGMLLGAAGGILGSIVGFAFAQFVSSHVFGSYISFRPLLVPVTILVSIAVTGAACLLPIRSATRVEPALVLKGE